MIKFAMLFNPLQPVSPAEALLGLRFHQFPERQCHLAVSIQPREPIRGQDGSLLSPLNIRYVHFRECLPGRFPTRTKRQGEK
ncbi:hypothetical protein [Sinorhizobium meliloti]|uniref:hypothetical protein n=1 Tax=Rhizobium meliloti TaxID=382 RepID=UPI003F1494C6